MGSGGAEPGWKRPVPWAVALGSLAASFAFWAPAFVPVDATGFGDWQMVHHNWEVGWVALTRWGEWPLWDPYHCGGVPMLGHPESQHFSPFFLLSLVLGPLGTVLATKLMVVAHTAAGIAGGGVWARRAFGLRPAPSALVGLAWAWSSFWGWHVAGGHATFVPFLLAPWLLLAWRAMAADLRWAAAVAALMTLTVLEGGTYPFPYFVLLLAFETIVLLVRPPEGPEPRRARARILVGGLAAAVLTALLGAIRFLPILHTLEIFPRTVESTDALGLDELLPMFTRHDIPWHHPDHEFVWPEYASYMGWPVVLLGAAGLGVAAWRKRFGPILALLLFTGLMLGDLGPYAPWSLLHRLPVYESLRVPSRFTVLVGLYLALLAGMAVDALLGARPRGLAGLADWLRGRRWSAVLPWIVVLAVVADPFVRNVQINDRWNGPPLRHDDPAARLHLIRTPRYGAVSASLPRRNQGTRACYFGNMRWRIARPLWEGDGPQARVVAGRGEVTAWQREPHRMWAEVRMGVPGMVVFNQNYHPDWVSDVGSVVDHRGLLAVRVPAGTERVEVRYAPPTLVPGLALSATGLVLLLLWVGLARRLPRARFRKAGRSRPRSPRR